MLICKQYKHDRVSSPCSTEIFYMVLHIILAFLVSYICVAISLYLYIMVRDGTVMHSLPEGTCCRSDLGQASPPALIGPWSEVKGNTQLGIDVLGEDSYINSLCTLSAAPSYRLVSTIHTYHQCVAIKGFLNMHQYIAS